MLLLIIILWLQKSFYYFWTLNVKSNHIKLKNIAEIIRELREQNGLLLRQVAAEIEIDQALLSKIERGERMPTKDQVIRLAKFYKVDLNEFLIAFISDKLVYELQNEEVALKAMQVLKRKLTISLKRKMADKKLIEKLLMSCRAIALTGLG
ncbi:MAG: helix-turn-helix domain-containing protein [Bacteroidota bacterium]|nr:MAG: helix-turn-helix domain-containing protein [Bacteroidota bacterium]